MKQLHISNGDCAIDVMQQAKIKGEFLAWRDVLHESSVFNHLSLQVRLQKLFYKAKTLSATKAVSFHTVFE